MHYLVEIMFVEYKKKYCDLCNHKKNKTFYVCVCSSKIPAIASRNMYHVSCLKIQKRNIKNYLGTCG
jgi:hypothetical protein